MRLLSRDLRTIYIASYEGLEAEVDASGRYTGRHVPQYSDPAAFSASVSAAKGEASGAVFGQSLDYDRTVLVDDPAFDVEEPDRLWVDNGVDEAHDYEVAQIARTPNVTAIAVKRVEASA